ncbi:hypothetical protein FA95DRAFT_1565981, partial [Auriscalpium vulgare]
MVGLPLKHCIRRLAFFLRRRRPSTRPLSENEVLAQAQQSDDTTSLQPTLEETDEQATVRRAHAAEHNALQAICRLPPELLAIIFAYVASENLCYGINLTFTCQHFRRIAIAQPTIWANNIAFNVSSEWRELMLVRAQDVPLTIALFRHGSRGCFFQFVVPPTDLDFISSHLYRTDTLRFISGWPNQCLLDCFVGHPAPVLQRLEVFIRDYDPDVPFQFPPHFLGDAAPRLRHLTLSTASRHPWEIPFMRGLASLEMTYNCLLGRMPPLGELLDALDNMPQLKRLRLNISKPPNTGDQVVSVAPQRIVTLPNLTEMHLRTLLARGADILPHIAFPTSTPLHIIVDIWGDHDPAVFDKELSTYLALPRAPVAKLIIAPPPSDENHTYVPDVAIEVSAWHVNAPGGSSSDFSLEVNVFRNFEFRLEVIRAPAFSSAVLRAFASPDLQALTIVDDSWKENAAWPLTGGDSAGLRTLEVSGNVANALTRAVTNNPPAEEFLPSLTTLTLHNTTVEQVSDMEAPRCTVFRHPMTDWLAARKEAGRPVELIMDVFG